MMVARAVQGVLVVLAGQEAREAVAGATEAQGVTAAAVMGAQVVMGGQGLRGPHQQVQLTGQL